MTAQPDTRPSNPWPFWVSIGVLAVAVFAASRGGWWLALIPLSTWGLFSVLDILIGNTSQNADPETEDQALFWHKAITLIWFPLQFCLVFGMIYYATQISQLSVYEMFWLFFGVGVVSGTIGIVYAHELIHQRNKLERWLGDLLLASVLYSHFRSEHLLVHHTYVGTPRDLVTARYNEGFHQFFPRVLLRSPASAWRAEAALLARRGDTPFHRDNPFLRYIILQALMLLLAALLGGWTGVILFSIQAFVAIWQLELVNYVEHYGLTRKHLGGGKYESVYPRHSWNASPKVSNWLLINLQRHSNHHYKPDRRFPLLQSYGPSEAPQLPFGYPVMTMFAMIPPLFRRIMNPRVRKWHAMFYPEITDWSAYKTGNTPMPR